MDAWLARMYERYGARYATRATALIVSVIGIILVPLLTAVPARYEGLSVDQALRAVLVVDVLVMVVCTIVGLASRGYLRTLMQWTANPNPQLADEARTAAYALPQRVASVGAVSGLILALPTAVAVLTVPGDHTTTLDLIEVSVGAAAALATGLLAVYLLVELVLLPVRASLGRQTVLEGPSTGLGTRLSLVILSVTFIGVTAGGLWAGDRESDGAGGLLGAMVVGLVVTLGLATILTPLLAGSVLGPIRDLIRGTRAVGQGDLGVDVPVATADELGELAASFNRMVDGLREREALRGEKDKLLDELQASRARIVAASDESRRRVERDLHDGAQQHLVMVNLKLGLLERNLDEDPTAARAIAAESRADLDRALAELRDLAHGIYPTVLSSDGLPAALAEAVEQVPIACELDPDGAGRYSPELEAAIYFCCLEALQNAAKHAGDGARVRVRLEQRGRDLRFEVSDDGVGFDTAAANGSAGLQNMTDRIGALGGELTVESTPGAGTKVAGSVPVEG